MAAVPFLIAGLLAAISLTSCLPPPPVVAPQPIAGMVDMSGCPTPSVTDQVHGLLGGCALFLNWADLEPTEGTFDFSKIDVNLARIKTFNAKYPTETMGLKLRVLAGASSPAWALAVGGPPVYLDLCRAGATASWCAGHFHQAVPRFWTTEYGTKYNKMMTALSNRYKANLDLRDVAITRCTTIFGEPMIRTYGIPSNSKALLDAGYTQAKDLVCQRAAMDAMKPLFPSAFISESFSTYEGPVLIGTTYTTGYSDYIANLLSDELRTKLGARATLGNNELGRTNGDNAAEYSHQKAIGGSLYYQLESLDRLQQQGGSQDKWTLYSAAVTVAVDQGASYVEIRGADYRYDIAGFKAALGPLVPGLKANAAG